MRASLLYLLQLCSLLLNDASSFQVPVGGKYRPRRLAFYYDNHSLLRLTMKTEQKADEMDIPEYRNAATGILSNFMKNNKDKQQQADPLASVNFNAPKLKRPLPLERLAAALDAELYQKEWFVTGNVNAMYFRDDFVFIDPDVKLEGIEPYARGVYKLFNQETSRAEIISTDVSGPNTITCTWRLSGDVQIGPGLKIKPYIVYTDFTVDATSGLIVFQEDRFAIPQWDILLSSLFPFLIGKITAPPAPRVKPRVVPKSRAPTISPLEEFFQNLFLLGKKQ
jgi:hypothetical protein